MPPCRTPWSVEANGCGAASRRTAFVCECLPEVRTPTATVAAIATATAAGTSASAGRRHRSSRRRGAGGTAAASSRTRARSSGDAEIRAERISLTIASCSGCDICTHPLFELLQGSAQARVAVRGRDPEDARGRLAVEVEQDAERDHLSLARRELGERALERRRQTAEDALLGRLPFECVRVLAAATPFLGAEVVERGRPGELAEPGACACAPRVETPPLPQRLLEGLGGQVLGCDTVTREVDQIGEDVVEMTLGDRREAGNLDRVHAG